MGSHRDASEEVRASEAILTSERNYRALFELIPQGVIVHRSDGSVESANPAAEEILGLDAGGLGLPEPSRPHRREDGSEMPAQDHPVLRALASGKPVRNVVFGVYNPRRGEDVWVRCDAVPLFDEGSDGPRRVFASFSDITAARQMQAALIQAQKMEAIGHLASGIAHDFNNILASVLGYAELALMATPSDQTRLRGYLEQIDTAGQRARDLVRQLLIFSRGEATGAVRSLSMDEPVRDAVALLRPLLPATIEIRLRVDDRVPMVRADPTHIQQLCMNLGVNARDAMPEGGVLEIELCEMVVSEGECATCRARVAGTWACIIVRDSGSGIAEEHRSRLFEPFFSTKSTANGSGMGLAVVRGLMQGYAGHVLLESSPGRGSEFRLLFPLDSGAEPVVPTDVHIAPAVVPRGTSVLVVDDEPAIRELFSELIINVGAAATLCSDGREACELLRSAPESFDVVVTDLTMPNMDGLELVRRLRTLRPDIGVVLCSGYTERCDDSIGAELVISDCLPKPVAAADLLAAIVRALSWGRVARERRRIEHGDTGPRR
jgi:PAS domain S-box-containing protein